MNYPITCPECKSSIHVAHFCGSTGSLVHQYICRKCGHIWSINFKDKEEKIT